ncbi:hypothetical protein ACWEQ7_02735 [Streptomyces sp. NPDC004069]
MDIVYVVKPGDDNEELRYSLRSLAAHLPHERVWLAGHRPAWVSDEVGHIPVAQKGSRFRNSTGNLHAACEHPDVAEHFVYFNDDFFLMQPLDQVPVLHRGDVREVIAATPHSQYRVGAMQTLAVMRRIGLDGDGPLLSYELHLPMPMSKAHMLKVLLAGASVPALHKRTLYGNFHHIGGDQVTDVKIKGPYDPGPDGPFLSTTEASFERGAVGERIRAAFPEPCRYETDTGPGDGPAVREAQPDHPPPPVSEELPAIQRPSPRAPKADWVAYADRQNPADHSQMTKSQLIAAYGG